MLFLFFKVTDDLILTNNQVILFAYFLFPNYFCIRYCKSEDYWFFQNQKRMLNSTDLQNYIDNFYGYGNFHGDYWFIGIEEDGGKVERDVQSRIDSWFNLGSINLIDNGIHHHNIGNDKFFRPNDILQQIWDKLIVVYAILIGYNPNLTADRKEIQRADWGRIDSNNCLIKLFPLPSPNSNVWNYNNWSSLPFLSNREIYKIHIVDSRVTFIQDKIALYSPRLVLMYGDKYIQYWNRLAFPFINEWHQERIQNSHWKYYLQNGTLFVVTPHPIGVYSYEFWKQVGNRIIEEMPEIIKNPIWV